MRTQLYSAVLAALVLLPAGAWSALPELVESGQKTEALAALAQGADVNARSVDGTTALHWAVYQDDVELIEQLIDKGADVNVANDYGATPLSTAAIDADAKVIRLLLEAGADPAVRNAENETALMIAARAGKNDAVGLLLEHGADIDAAEGMAGQTALMWAAASRHPETVRVLLEAGAKVDASSTFHDWDRVVTAEPRIKAVLADGGFTALLFAAREGCADCVVELLNAGADIDKADPWGVTPLVMALLNMNFDTAAVLIENGADVNRWDWWGRTPLYAAIDLNTLPQGARPDLPTTDTRTGLDIARLLLERGANPNLRLKKEPPARGGAGDRGFVTGSTDAYVLTTGATPLHRAAKSSDDAAIKLLLEYGADVNMPNQIWGITPTLVAAGVGHNYGNFREYPSRGAFKTDAEALATVKLLQAAGGDILARDKRGFTAAHGAAEMGWTSTLQYLYEQGVPLNAAALNPSEAQAGGFYLYERLVTFPAPTADDTWTPEAVALHKDKKAAVELIQKLLAQ